MFVICKTPMAKSITKRTLCGFSNITVNAHYFDDLVNMLKNKPEQFKKRILKGSYWNKEVKKMKFDAVVGNPPYQAFLGGASPLPIYQVFVENAIQLNPSYVSMITPARWFNTGTGLDAFREKMLHDDRISVMSDFINARTCFTNVEIKGGVQYFLWNRIYHRKCNITTHYENGNIAKSFRPLIEPGMDSYIRNTSMISILQKVKSKEELSFSSLISSRDPFGYDIRLPGSYKVAKH